MIASLNRQNMLCTINVDRYISLLLAWLHQISTPRKGALSKIKVMIYRKMRRTKKLDKACLCLIHNTVDFPRVGLFSVIK